MEILNLTWRNIEIAFTPESFGQVDYIELRSKDRVALPVSETGYRSNFVPVGTVDAYGGALAFVTAWLEKEAKTWDGVAHSCSCSEEVRTKIAPALRQAHGAVPGS